MSSPLFRLVAQPVAFGWAGVTEGWESDHSHLLGEPVSGYSLTFDGLCRIGNRHSAIQVGCDYAGRLRRRTQLTIDRTSSAVPPKTTVDGSGAAVWASDSPGSESPGVKDKSGKLVLIMAGSA